MATYRGKKVSLNKVMRGDVKGKKFKVFVKKGSRVVKVNSPKTCKFWFKKIINL